MKATNIGASLALALLWACAACHAQQAPAVSGGPPPPANAEAKAKEEDLRAERARRLAKLGRLVDDQPTELFPTDPGPGEVFSTPIRALTGKGEVRALRLHFYFNKAALRASGQETSWRVHVSDLDNKVSWVFDPNDDPDADDFWSPEIPGRVARVKIFSTAEKCALALVADERIEYLEPVRELSYVKGTDDTIPIDKAPLAQQRVWGKSVARLTFVAEGQKEPDACTGFLIAPDLFMTNDHCPRTEKEIRRAVVDFDYDTPSSKPKMYRLKFGEDLPRSPRLDFAIYRLNKAVTDRDFLRLKDDDQALSKTKPLFIIQHPGGRPKRLSSFECQVIKPDADLYPPSDFGHECDTEGGSSGSPVQDTDGSVIGLHHYGFDKPPAPEINQAVKMGEILKFIAHSDDKLFKALAPPANKQ